MCCCAYTSHRTGRPSTPRGNWLSATQGDRVEQATAHGAAKALAAVATFAMLGIGTARATDQGITGTKFLPESGKFVLCRRIPRAEERHEQGR